MFLWQIFVPNSSPLPCNKVIYPYPLLCDFVIPPNRTGGVYPCSIAFGLGHGECVWFDLLSCVPTMRREWPRMRDMWSRIGLTYSLK